MGFDTENNNRRRRPTMKIEEKPSPHRQTPQTLHGATMNNNDMNAPFDYTIITSSLVLRCLNPNEDLPKFGRVTRLLSNDEDPFGGSFEAYHVQYDVEQSIDLLYVPGWIQYNRNEMHFKNPSSVKGTTNNEIVFQKGYFMNVSLGALLSPNHFKAYSKDVFFRRESVWMIQFDDHSMQFSIECQSRYIYTDSSKIVIDRIDKRRGVVISISSKVGFVLHICLDDNPKELKSNKSGEFQKVSVTPLPRYSAIRLVVNLNKRDNSDPEPVRQAFARFLHFFSENNIPVHFGKINFNYNVFMDIPIEWPDDNRYGWEMLANVGSRLHEQMSANSSLTRQMKELNDNQLFYYVCLTLRHLSKREYFLNLTDFVSSIVEHYHKFYKQSFLRYLLATSYSLIPSFVLSDSSVEVRPMELIHQSNVSSTLARVSFDGSDENQHRREFRFGIHHYRYRSSCYFDSNPQAIDLLPEENPLVETKPPMIMMINTMIDLVQPLLTNEWTIDFLHCYEEIDLIKSLLGLNLSEEICLCDDPFFRRVLLYLLKKNSNYFEDILNQATIEYLPNDSTSTDPLYLTYKRELRELIVASGCINEIDFLLSLTRENPCIDLFEDLRTDIEKRFEAAFDTYDEAQVKIEFYYNLAYSDVDHDALSFPWIFARYHSDHWSRPRINRITRVLSQIKVDLEAYRDSIGRFYVSHVRTGRERPIPTATASKVQCIVQLHNAGIKFHNESWHLLIMHFLGEAKPTEWKLVFCSSSHQEHIELIDIQEPFLQLVHLALERETIDENHHTLAQQLLQCLISIALYGSLR